MKPIKIERREPVRPRRKRQGVPWYERAEVWTVAKYAALTLAGIMSVTRQIPTGATFTVEACNNAFDASPTWEDVTQAVTSGNKFFLNNTTKTAAQWGFNLRIKVKRNGATGDCYIVSAGGNFE